MTLMRSFGVTLWSFWQNAAQLKVYGDQASTLIDNAAVIQVFGARNRRMAEEFVSLVGGIDADSVMQLGSDEQLLLIDGGKPVRCDKTRYYADEEFRDLRRLGRSR